MTTSQINDRKSAESETDRALEKVALVIGTTMPNRFGHPSDRVRFYRFAPNEIILACYAAHCLLNLMTEDRGLKTEG
jgi:hypothetical protein